jgi:hypothetical protein
VFHLTDRVSFFHSVVEAINFGVDSLVNEKAVLAVVNSVDTPSPSTAGASKKTK